MAVVFLSLPLFFAFKDNMTDTSSTYSDVQEDELKDIQNAISESLNSDNNKINIKKLKLKLQDIVEDTSDLTDNYDEWYVKGKKTGYIYKIKRDGTITKYENEKDLPYIALKSIEIKNSNLEISTKDKTGKIQIKKDSKLCNRRVNI